MSRRIQNVAEERLRYDNHYFYFDDNRFYVPDCEITVKKFRQSYGILIKYGRTIIRVDFLHDGIIFIGNHFSELSFENKIKLCKSIVDDNYYLGLLDEFLQRNPTFEIMTIYIWCTVMNGNFLPYHLPTETFLLVEKFPEPHPELLNGRKDDKMFDSYINLALIYNKNENNVVLADTQNQQLYPLDDLASYYFKKNNGCTYNVGKMMESPEGDFVLQHIGEVDERFLKIMFMISLFTATQWFNEEMTSFGGYKTKSRKNKNKYFKKSKKYLKLL